MEVSCAQGEIYSVNTYFGGKDDKNQRSKQASQIQEINQIENKNTIKEINKPKPKPRSSLKR